MRVFYSVMNKSNSGEDLKNNFQMLSLSIGKFFMKDVEANIVKKQV